MKEITEHQPEGEFEALDPGSLTFAEAYTFAALGNEILADADTGNIALEIPSQVPPSPFIQNSGENPLEAALSHELQRVESLARLAQENGTPLTAFYNPTEGHWQGNFAGIDLEISDDEAAMILGVSQDNHR